MTALKNRTQHNEQAKQCWDVIEKVMLAAQAKSATRIWFTRQEHLSATSRRHFAPNRSTSGVFLEV